MSIKFRKGRASNHTAELGAMAVEPLTVPLMNFTVVGGSSSCSTSFSTSILTRSGGITDEWSSFCCDYMEEKHK
jgi:hypothetical protein